MKNIKDLLMMLSVFSWDSTISLIHIKDKHTRFLIILEI